MKNRIATWCILLLIAALIYGINHMITSKKDKTPIYVSAPIDMESAFGTSLKSAGMKKGYKIVFTDSNSANITIVEGGSNEEGYQRILFSPFICAMGESTDESKLQEADILVKNQFDSTLYDFDVIKIVDDVIENKTWKDLGLEDLDEIIVYYPAQNTSYWYDFYNFMLVNVNDGKYPKNSSEMSKAQDTIQKFLDSKNTEAVTKFDEKIERNGGFTANAVYFIPEKLAIQLSRKSTNHTVKLLYPRYTVNYNYYIYCPDNDEEANNIISNLSSGYFYKYLSNKAYRSVEYQSVNTLGMYYFNNCYNHRNTYTVINIEEQQEETIMYEETVTETEE